jgi:hypothetical protein
MGHEESDSVILPQPKRQKIFAYLGFLIVLLAFGSPSGGLIDIPISFFLKNKLHLQPAELANFRLVGRFTSLSIVCLWICAGYLESYGDGRSRVSDVVRCD